MGLIFKFSITGNIPYTYVNYFHAFMVFSPKNSQKCQIFDYE